jgi:NADPH2 dehydrogenase
MHTAAALRSRVAELGLDLPVDRQILSTSDGSPLAVPINLGGTDFGGLNVANRLCIHAMEGWDANPHGSPTEHTLRRWRNFGLSGAKLIWGGEAAAVRPDGRANPNQTMAIASNRAGLQASLDPHYKDLPERKQLVEIKQRRE